MKFLVLVPGRFHCPKGLCFLTVPKLSLLATQLGTLFKLQTMCRDEFNDASGRLRDATHDALCEVKISSCVWHSRFVTLSHLHAYSTVGRLPTCVELGIGDVRLPCSKLWLSFPARQLGGSATRPPTAHRKKRHQIFPSNSSNAFQSRPTPSLDQLLALHNALLNNFVVHNDTMTGCTPTATQHSFCPSGIQLHVHVVRTLLAPRHSLSEIQTDFMHLIAISCPVQSSAPCKNRVTMSATRPTITTLQHLRGRMGLPIHTQKPTNVLEASP